MAGWEFTYVDLRVEYRGEAIESTKHAHDRARDAAIDRVKDAIAQLEGRRVGAGRGNSVRF